MRAGDLIAKKIASGRINHTGIDKAGRLIDGLMNDGAEDISALRVLLLGQCTLTWLKYALVAWAWSKGQAMHIDEGGYDTILQDLDQRARDGTQYDLVITHAWDKQGPGGAASLRHEGSGGEAELWEPVWGLVTSELQAKLIHIGYDWLHYGPSGHHLSSAPGGHINRTADINQRLRAQMPAGSYFIDPTAVSALYGKRGFYDLRNFFWTKNPYSDQGAFHMAKHLWAAFCTLNTGPMKALILDLDNVLWGGEVGEAGAAGITLGGGPDGEAFQAFQHYCKTLKERGILLAVASKNDAKNAREPFETRPECILGLDDFSAFEANWGPKNLSLERIAQTLGIGLDTMVFFDDNPAEREIVRQFLPQVETVDVPGDPSEYITALDQGLFFETLAITDADLTRVSAVQDDKKRAVLRESVASLDDYLKSLEMTASVEPVADRDMQRVVQLIAKTNQFNFTTRRLSYDEAERMRSDGRSLITSLRLQDRFSNYGIVGVLAASPGADEHSLKIDVFLMSCRILARTAENYFLSEFIKLAKEKGYARLTGKFLPTARNALISGKFDELGFSLVETRQDGSKIYRMDLAASEIPTSMVRRSAVE